MSMPEFKLPHSYEDALEALLEKVRENKALKAQLAEHKKSQYPEVLKASHVAEIMGVSPPKAYDLMRLSDFPRLEVDGIARVRRDSFFRWLDSRDKTTA